MMFGHIESRADRIEHLRMLRDLQDRTGGFTAFIGWTFQPGNTELGGPRGDNAPSTCARWRWRGCSSTTSRTSKRRGSPRAPRSAPASLAFGVNDMGSTMIEENVVSSAGTVHHMNEPEIVAAVKDAGFIPMRRTMLYERLGAPLHA